MREGRDSQWLIVGLTLSGETLELGPYEKRYAEQVLADVRNHVANGDTAPLESSGFAYADIDLTSLGMEPQGPN